MFYVAYTSLTRTSAKPKRPILFAYNGGPGGSSAGVHIGAFGPRVVAPIEPSRLAGASDRLIDNPDTLLRDADLVFIDAIGSGLSRLSPGSDPASFYGVRADAAATAAFIGQYFDRNGDAGRPFFIMGESYGTLRTVLAARLLQEQGRPPSGLILMGLILDNSTLFAQPGNDEPYWLSLPSEAATARFHGKAGAALTLGDVVKSTERFATGPYLIALGRGSGLNSTDEASIRTTMCGLLGVEAKTVRVAPDRFEHDLLGHGQTVSHADGRFAGSGSGQGPLADPLYGVVLPLYGRDMKRYLQDELRMPDAIDYRVLDTGVADAWQWGDTPLGSPTSLSVSGTLSDALRADRDLTVYVGGGIYDLTSPMLAADYTLAHMDASSVELERIASHRYESGHMIYFGRGAPTAYP